MPSVEERLNALERRLAERARSLERAHDSRCVFTHTYALLTRQLADTLPGNAAVDAEWLTDLAEAFAARYFDALDATGLPRSWTYAFAVMEQQRTSVLEDLLFGMAVHIVHDLPLTLCDIGGGRVDSAHIADFHAVNDVMASSIEPIVDATATRYAPYVRWLDRLGGRYDNLLTDYGIRLSRGLAWYNAVRLGDGRASERARKAIDDGALHLIGDIARPPVWSVRIALRVLRWLVSFLRTWPSEGTERGMTVRAR
jgi:hypothetical protein